MIQFKEKMVRNKFLLGGVALAGIAASVYYFFLRKMKY